MPLLTACNTSANEKEIPDGAITAECIQGETFDYVYKNSTLYIFYSNGELQDDDMLDIVQNAIDSTGTVRAYLDTTFQEGACNFTDYQPSEKNE